MMFTRLILAASLALPAAPLGASPWDLPPETWDQAQAYQILRDSPWSPAGIKFDVKVAFPPTDPQTGFLDQTPSSANRKNGLPVLRIGEDKPLRPISVLWWSSKTVRMAQQRLRQLRSSKAAQPVRAPELPDYVLAIQDDEPLTVLRDTKEDLRDTVFLELPSAATIDLESVRFVEAAGDEDARVEFHFPRQLDGRPTLDPNTERIVFHCKVTAKTPRTGRTNALSLRAEFKPRAMRVRGVPDL